MITISVSKEEVRRHAEYESDRYKVEINQEVDDPNKIQETVTKTFALIQEEIEKQKSTNGAQQTSVQN